MIQLQKTTITAETNTWSRMWQITEAGPGVCFLAVLSLVHHGPTAP